MLPGSNLGSRAHVPGIRLAASGVDARLKGRPPKTGRV